MRKRLYQVIELSNGDDWISSLYDCFIIITIAISIFPLAFRSENYIFHIIEKATVLIFIIDYLLRLLTADLKYNNSSFISFLKYPFNFYSIVDLLSILPSVSALNSSFKLLRILRIFRAFRVFRVFKALRYSKSFKIIISVFSNTKESLIAVVLLALSYIFISALLIFNVEPTTFDTFFDAVYWATVSLTTVGYGDIYPVTTIGRTITMISSIFGISIIALPAGIITAGYMSEINKL